MFSKLLVITAALVVVSAESSASTPSTTSVPTLDPCILACIEPAATQNGCTYTDVQCVCASAQFQADATACLKQHCTSTDLSAALGLQSAECAGVSVSASDTGSVTPHSVSFTLASTSGTASSGGIATSGTTTPGTITTTGAPAASITTTSPTTTGITTGTSTTIAPATTTTTSSSAAAAPSLVANIGGSVGAAIVAIIVGFLAL